MEDYNQWKKTYAKISLQQERSIGLFKKKYALLLTYYAEVARDKTEEEKAVDVAHEGVLNQLEGIFPILETEELPRPSLDEAVDKDKVFSKKLFVQDFEVTQEVFNTYKKEKSITIEYKEDDPTCIRIY